MYNLLATCYMQSWQPLQNSSCNITNITVSDVRVRALMIVSEFTSVNVARVQRNAANERTEVRP